MKKIGFWLVVAGLIAFYLATHLYQLTNLPVFADEAIYIRWAQLIIDDWRQYLFFPLNDGKTPLMMWLMVPALKLGSDPLWAGRVVSVIIGLMQMLVMGGLSYALTKRKMTAFLAMLFTAILPYWFFHHRMALTDGLMTLMMSLTVLSGWMVVSKSRKWPWAILTGLAFGLALWSKLPALLLIPALPLLTLIEESSWQKRFHQLLWLGGSIGLGLALFFALKIHPAFSQLFGRGSDFLYPWQEVILQGQWRSTIINFPNYFYYFFTYLTWPILFLNLVGLFNPKPKQRRMSHVLFWSAILFLLPIGLMGRVVYARYLLPVSIFFTAGAAVTGLTLVDWIRRQTQLGWKYLISALLFVLLLANLMAISAQFIFYSVTDVTKMPLVSSDQEQYLYEWSAGYGITKAVAFIQEQAQHQTVAVATEGSFGTMPDGVLMYLHQKDVSNIYVEGIGYPVENITEPFWQRAQDFDRVYLIVNNHRLKMNLDDNSLMRQYCRPAYAPCLQIWDITDQLPNLPIKDSSI